MGFGLWGVGKVKEKEELKCPLVFSIGWMTDGTVSGIGNTVPGEENEVSYEHVEFEEPVRYVGGG